MNYPTNNWNPNTTDPAYPSLNRQAFNQLNNRQQVRHGFSQNTITLQLQEGTIYLPFYDIVYFQGERNYTYVVTRNKRKILIAKTLKEFEAQLSPQTFFRCHKSFLVNGIHIQKQKEGNVLELSGQNEVTISRRKKSEFKTWLSNLQSMIRSRDFAYASFV